MNFYSLWVAFKNRPPNCPKCNVHLDSVSYSCPECGHEFSVEEIEKMGDEVVEFKVHFLFWSLMIIILIMFFDFYVG